jgi:hypothetical protein
MGGLVAVGDLEGYLHFLTRDEGKFAARIKLDSNAVMSLIAGTKSNQLIAETREGGLYAVSVAENAVKPTNTSKPKPSSDPQERSEPTPAKIILQEPDSVNESGADSIVAPSQQPSAESTEERSILFQKNDSILLPDVETAPAPNSNNSAPGIRLPSPEAP